MLDLTGIALTTLNTNTSAVSSGSLYLQVLRGTDSIAPLTVEASSSSMNVLSVSSSEVIEGVVYLQVLRSVAAIPPSPEWYARTRLVPSSA